MKKIIISVFALLVSFQAKTQNKYWVEFVDKGPIGRSIDESAYQDAPINTVYLDSISDLGITPINYSNWINGITCFLSEDDVKKMITMSFIKNIVEVRAIATHCATLPVFQNYGLLFNQINATVFKQMGLSGKNIVIGIADIGFENADKDPLLKHVFSNKQVLGTKDFVTPGNADFFRGKQSQVDRHGTYVWRMMAARDSVHNETIGLASDAKFYLARTDHGATESRIEEDNWIAALEWFHSNGVKIVNSSIGYSLDFANNSENHRPDEIDGYSTKITKAAQIATERNMILVVSAGNDGENKKWKIISAPADAPGVIAVGASDSQGLRATYSGVGPEKLSYVKPDVSCYSVATGTSFTAPVITGIIASMLQKNSRLTTEDVVQIIRKSSSLFPFPNNYLGHGSPECGRILKLLDDQDYDFKRSMTKNAKKSIVLTVADYFSSARTVNVMHKKDATIVIDQLQMTIRDGTLTIKQPSGAKRTTVFTPDNVLEILWE